MPRTHGYSDKGKRCYSAHDWGENAIGAMIVIGLISGSVNIVVFPLG